MENVIPQKAIINSIYSNNYKLIIVGALIDLTMMNGWVKRDEFVPIDFNEAIGNLKRISAHGIDNFEFASKLIDANNNVRNVYICGQAECFETGRDDVTIPTITGVIANVDGDGLECDNVRLVTHLSVGCQVIGVDYANGDYLRKNVTDKSDVNKYR